MPGPQWFCAVKLNGGVTKRTTSLKSAQKALGNGDASNRQAIIPMKGTQAGDPHALDKSWAKGSMFWNGWDDITAMRKMCVDAGVPTIEPDSCTIMSSDVAFTGNC